MAGLCGVATIAEVEAQGWSLNPGRYVHGHGVIVDDVDLLAAIERLLGDFEQLDGEAHVLSDQIALNMTRILGGPSGDRIA